MNTNNSNVDFLSGVEDVVEDILVKKESPDNINHPSHYNHGRIETIDFIEDCLGKDGFQAYCLGNVLKYISRANFKGKHDEDIRKANWYLNKVVEKIEEKNE